MTAKELIIKLLEMPDLDVPVVVKSQQARSQYRFNVAEVDSALDEQDNWTIEIIEAVSVYQADQHPMAAVALDCGKCYKVDGQVYPSPSCPTHWQAA